MGFLLALALAAATGCGDDDGTTSRDGAGDEKPPPDVGVDRDGAPPDGVTWEAAVRDRARGGARDRRPPHHRVAPGGDAITPL